MKIKEEMLKKQESAEENEMIAESHYVSEKRDYLLDTINSYIKIRGLKKKHIAEQMNLSQPCLYEKLNGINELKFSEICILSRILSIPHGEFDGLL